MIVSWLTVFSDSLWCLVFAAACAAGGVISFYCSSLARSALQALGPAVLAFFAAGGMLIAGWLPESYLSYPLWRGFLVYLFGVPVLTLTVIGLAYWNYQRVLVDWKVLLRNVLTLTAALTFVITSTTALYHRAWEFITPTDPPHGPARLAPSQRVMLQTPGSALTFGLPDGRIWLSCRTISNPSLGTLLTGGWLVKSIKETFAGGRFLEGTNWDSVAFCAFDVVGIQKDGSLWVSEKSDKLVWLRLINDPSPHSRPVTFVRLGDDHNWKSIVSYGYYALLLKNDGTLWKLGATSERIDFRRFPDWPGLRAFKPKQVGTASDWAEIWNFDYTLYLRKTDGRA